MNFGFLYLALLDLGYNPHTEETVMKIKMNIRCMPEQARRFPGLPDVIGLQEEMMGGVGAKMRESLSATDSEALMKALMSGTGGVFEEMQKQFWSQITGQNTKDSE